EQLAHENLCDFTRFMAHLEGGAPILDEAGIVAVRGQADWPSTRVALRTDSALLSAESFVERAEAFLLGAHGKTACVFVRDGHDEDVAPLLLAHGFREYGNTPEMACDAVLPAREPVPGFTVRLANSPADVRGYAQVAGHAFRHLGIPEDMTVAGLDRPNEMLQSSVLIAIAERDDRVVAGAMVVMVGAVPNGYVAWVSCHDDARGNGLGDAVTRHVTNEAFARGAEMVSLEASKFGEHTYARMGYRELYRYRMLIKI
ncbi:MAG TPA: GNAT family N-acetyltransferase, partial [Acidimicrobiia bacterium]|nr:GNAT family N-acetyltransferase [Acidimicrobiia bacterium]